MRNARDAGIRCHLSAPGQCGTGWNKSGGLIRRRQRSGLLFSHILAAAGDSALALLGAQNFGLAGFAAISLA
jgi:hypothetical protein